MGLEGKDLWSALTPHLAQLTSAAFIGLAITFVIAVAWFIAGCVYHNAWGFIGIATGLILICGTFLGCWAIYKKPGSRAVMMLLVRCLLSSILP